MLIKRILSTGIALAVLCFSTAIAAQSEVALATRADKLQALSEQLKNRDVNDRLEAKNLARVLGIPLRRELPNGRVLELQRFIPGVGPVFYITYNIDAADTVSTDELWPGGTAGLSLDGSGMTVGEWDGGGVLGDHPDLYPRVNQIDVPTGISNHSTHVAGTLIGAGVALLPEARGMAYAAQLDAWDWNSDTSEMAAAAAGGLLLSNHSYGIAAGWIYMGGAAPDEWWWIGGTGSEDPNFGYYDATSQTWDQIAFDAPYYLMVKAAGNDRWDTGPAPGEQYTVVDQDGGFLDYSTQNRPADCAPAGYDCLPTTSVAKNILTVGAVNDVPGGYLPLAGPSGVQMTAFSGWGPTDDGRIKPDVVANGWLLMSTYAQDPYYAAAIGTSMAAPNVTGSLLLLQQHHQDLHGSGNFMRAATLKALAIHTADEAGDAAGPDYEYGWGLLNTKSAAQLISQDGGTDHQVIESSLADGATDTVLINVSEPDAVVVATLAWMDPPGTPPAFALDPPDSMLVNDLDLRVVNGGATHMPWVLNPAAPANAAFPGDNTRDNVEQVHVSGDGAGAYSIEVSHKGSLLNSSAQEYSLIISIRPPPPVSSGLVIDEDFSQGLPAGWSVVTDRGRSWTIRTPVQGSARYDNLTGGSGNFAMVDNYVGGNYADTRTSLVTTALDLSSSTAAVLSFNSYFWWDFVETINVDVSTNGGTNWSNAWQHSGFSNMPVHHTLDLTGSIAGHAAVMLRFRFESGYLGPDGDFWQIDDVELEVFGGAPPPPPPPVDELPGQAGNPDPANGGSSIGIDSTLSWSAGQLATSHDVYLGTDSTLTAGDFRGNQTGTSYNPGTLAYSNTYYWRIDEVNNEGSTQGITWSFTTEAEPETGTMHVGDLDADRTEGARNRWQAEARIKIHDGDELPLAQATVSGVWGDGTNGSGTCTTDTTGWCSVYKNNLKAGVTSVSFAVTSVSHAAGHSYESVTNHDPESDSDGSLITIPREPGTGNTPPDVTISSPSNGAVFASAASIAFGGSASDTEDGNLSANLAWTSDLDGSLGTGSSFSAVLSDGNHQISAAVTDSGAESGSDSVSITVGSPASVTAHVGSLAGFSTVGSRNRWNANVTITVHDADHNPVANADVAGSWSNGAKGSGQCTTDPGGTCTVTKSNIKANVSAVSFSVGGIGGAGISYDAVSNHVSTIQVSGP